MSKPKILIFPFPLLAHYLRLATLLEGMSDDYQILFAGNCDAARYVERLGFETFPTIGFNPEQMLSCARKFDFSWLNETSLQQVLSSQIQAISAQQPELIISDSAQTARIAAEATSTKHIAVVNGYMTRYYRDLRCVPENHPARRYQAQTPPWIFAAITRVAEKVAMRQVHRPFRRIRKTLGLSVPSSYLDEFEGDYTAICDAESIFPLSRTPHNYRNIGPVFFDQVSQAEEKLIPDNETRPVLYVSLGSSGEWEGIRALNNSLFSRFLIIATGRAQECLSAPNIIIKPFVAASAILPRAALVLCHGGNGTIYQALSYRVPTLCRPSMFEQEWNVAQFESLGLVRRITATITVEELLQLIMETIADDSYRLRLQDASKLINLQESRRQFAQLVRTVIS